jgi:hypothetical protein
MKVIAYTNFFTFAHEKPDTSLECPLKPRVSQSKDIDGDEECERSP